MLDTLHLPPNCVGIHQTRYVAHGLMAHKLPRKTVTESVVHEKHVFELCYLLKSFQTAEQPGGLPHTPTHIHKGTTLGQHMIATHCFVLFSVSSKLGT